MSLKIRLAKIGRKNRAAYRVVVVEARTNRNGRVVASVGYFDPSKRTTTASLEKESIEHWLSKGAQPTASVVGLIKGDYKTAHYRRHPKTKEEKTK